MALNATVRNQRGCSRGRLLDPLETGGFYFGVSVFHPLRCGAFRSRRALWSTGAGAVRETCPDGLCHTL